MKPLRILTDDVETDPILNFKEYSETISNIVRNSEPKFSIGIYGEWGTGKTTLMSMIKKQLDSFVREEVFNWSDFAPHNRESQKLTRFLEQNYRLEWISDATITTPNDKTIRLVSQKTDQNVDAKGAYEVKHDHSLELSLNNSKDVATLIVDDEVIRNFDVKKEEDKRMYIHLREGEILTAWFNAWRYEREEQFALIALMKTIAYSMGNLPEYKEMKRVFLRGLEIIGKDILRHLAVQYVMTEKGVEEFESNILPKMELLSKVDKDTIYFDGVKKIEEDMKKVSGTHRVVVFIDDLDRCNSQKALEVFESTKVFLDIEGFIFIVGLSHRTITKLISLEYEKAGIKGSEYIRKIIQVYVNIPKWKSQDIKKLIDKISSRLDPEYAAVFKDEKKEDLITTAAGYNPREVKRLINRFIVAHSVDPSIDATEFLVTQALESRWSDFYVELDTNAEFRGYVSRYAHLDPTSRAAEIEKKKKAPIKPTEIENKVLLLDHELWGFLDEHKDIIPKIIDDWEGYKEKFASSADPRQEESALRIFRRLLGEDLKSATTVDEALGSVNKTKARIRDEFASGRINESDYEILMSEAAIAIDDIQSGIWAKKKRDRSR